MAKAITKTEVKVSTTHNRVAIVVKFVNGEVFKTATNRGSDTLSLTRPNGFNEQFGKITQAEMQKVFQFICKTAHENENHGDRFARLAKFFEGTTSIKDIIAQC